jgi:cell fate regulator YaaT (PSP1 superfamily)
MLGLTRGGDIMVHIVGVRLKKAGSTYYFDPDGKEIPEDTDVLVETDRGIEYGTVVIPNRDVPDDHIVEPLKKIIRRVTEEDRHQHQENKNKEKEAFDLCLKNIQKHGLPMNLVGVDYTFDRKKLLFFFVAEKRVDFRELVKDLASIFRTRIELRQIGVRDKAKMVGGVGICGRELCCSTFLSDFEPVSIQMAKEQGLSLNPSRISGQCGRLRCCLKYEEEAYKDVLQRAPKHGSLVQTPDGKAVVTYVSLVKERVKVTISIDQSDVIKEYPLSEISILENPSKEDTLNEMEDLSYLEGN